MTKEIVFHKQSIELFGKLKAKYIFTDKLMRKQLNEIVAFHKEEIEQTQNKVKMAKMVIEKIETPVLTPDETNVQDEE